jgi:uncharacterized protein YggE
MEKTLAAAAFMLVSALCVSAQYFGQEANVPLITVTGEAEVRVVPDEIILTIGVETSDKSLERAKTDNDSRVKRVLAVAPAFGIEPKHIQTSFITIEPWYRTYQVTESLEYRVRRTIGITLKDTTRFESLLSRVLQEGANNVQGIQFRTTELRKHRDTARALAIKAAREKAIALAAELNQVVGKAYRISEYSSGWQYPYGWGSMSANASINQNSVSSGSATAGEGTLALGQITVSASVSVSFVLR